jgi:hypothetical protein
MPTGKLTGKRKAVEPAPTYWDECKVKYENPTNARDENLEAEAIKGGLAAQKALKTIVEKEGKEGGIDQVFGPTLERMQAEERLRSPSVAEPDMTEMLTSYHHCLQNIMKQYTSEDKSVQANKTCFGGAADSSRDGFVLGSDCEIMPIRANFVLNYLYMALLQQLVSILLVSAKLPGFNVLFRIIKYMCVNNSTIGGCRTHP